MAAPEDEDDGATLSRSGPGAASRNVPVMSTPQSRAATSAAIGALTDFLLEAEAGAPRSAGAYLQQLVDEDGVGALAQGYYGLLNLSALLLAQTAADRGLEPRELLSRIALDLASEPEG